jgi:hypothetical protein
MKVRIVKASSNCFVLQCFSEREVWVGLQLHYNFWQKVEQCDTWTVLNQQVKYCSFKSKGSAMKAIKKLKVYVEKVRVKDQNFTLAAEILAGETGVVYECEV